MKHSGCIVFSAVLLLMLVGCQSQPATRTGAAYTPEANSQSSPPGHPQNSPSLFGQVAPQGNDAAAEKLSSALFAPQNASSDKAKNDTAAEKLSSALFTPQNASSDKAKPDFFKTTAPRRDLSENRLTPPQCDLADLTLQRTFLEIYYADASEIISRPALKESAVFKVKSNIPINVTSRNIYPPYNLIASEGEMDIDCVLESSRRKDVDTKIKKLHKKAYIGMDARSSACARLLRHAELKYRHNILKKYAAKVNYNTAGGKGIALELMNAIEVEKFEFQFSSAETCVYGKITMSLNPEKLSPQTSEFIGLNKREYLVLNEKNRVSNW